VGASRATGIWPKTSDRPLTKYVMGASGGQVGGTWGASRATGIWPKTSDRPEWCTSQGNIKHWWSRRSIDEHE